MGGCLSGGAPVPIGPSHVGGGKVSKQMVSFACNQAQGRRDYMEDTALVEFGTSKEGGVLEGCMLAAVFDGHGGARVAEYGQTHLYDVLSTNIGAHGKKLHHVDNATIENALIDSFLDLDDKIEGLPSVVTQVGSGGCFGGPSTVRKDIGNMGAVAVSVLMNESTMYFANCGDSRALLVRDGALCFATEDHTPEDPAEVARIQKAGGFIEDGRVDGILAVSRALGDHRFKCEPQLRPEDQEICAVPVITTIKRSTSDQFLILASDGLWAVMESEDCVNFVMQKVVKEGLSIGDTAEMLIAMSCNSLYTTDNISVVIIDLRGTPRPRSVALPMPGPNAQGKENRVKSLSPGEKHRSKRRPKSSAPHKEKIVPRGPGISPAKAGPSTKSSSKSKHSKKKTGGGRDKKGPRSRPRW